MTIWFTADEHFQHRNIIKYCNRPFLYIQEHDEALINNWNERVQADDTVFCLGDFSMNKQAVHQITSRLAGKKFLVPGNHDFCHPRHGQGAKLEKAKQEYESVGWAVCQLNAKIVFGEYMFSMNHFPPRDSDPKHEKWWPPVQPEGVWYLHGHVHTRWKVRDNMINVGVDQHNMAPISIDEIVKLIEEIG